MMRWLAALLLLAQLITPGFALSADSALHVWAGTQHVQAVDAAPLPDQPAHDSDHCALCQLLDAKSQSASTPGHLSEVRLGSFQPADLTRVVHSGTVICTQPRGPPLS